MRSRARPLPVALLYHMTQACVGACEITRPNTTLKQKQGERKKAILISAKLGRARRHKQKRIRNCRHSLNHYKLNTKSSKSARVFLILSFCGCDAQRLRRLTVVKSHIVLEVFSSLSTNCVVCNWGERERKFDLSDRHESKGAHSLMIVRRLESVA